jgi:hypothetical protein
MFKSSLKSFKLFVKVGVKRHSWRGPDWQLLAGYVMIRLIAKLPVY